MLGNQLSQLAVINQFPHHWAKRRLAPQLSDFTVILRDRWHWLRNAGRRDAVVIGRLVRLGRAVAFVSSGDRFWLCRASPRRAVVVSGGGVLHRGVLAVVPIDNDEGFGPPRRSDAVVRRRNIFDWRTFFMVPVDRRWHHR